MKTYRQGHPIFRSLIAGIKGKISFVGFALCLVLVGCVAGEGGKKNATCPSGQSYDTVARSCKGARVEDDAPTPTLSATSILEDSGVNQIELTYADSQNDTATSCSINAFESSGLVKQKINQGVLYKSSVDIVDAHNTKIFIQSGFSASVVADTSIPGLRGVIITVTSSTSTLDVVTLINGHATVSSWIEASAIRFGNVEAISEELSIEDISCSCVGGVCSASIEPTENFYGTTDFTYNITDEDGTSVDKIVKVNITSVNDNPVIALTGNITGVTERFDSDNSTVKTGNLFDDGVISREDSADGDPFGAYVSAELVSNPTYGVIYLQANGDYSYYTYKHQAADSFMVRLVDMEGGVSSNVTVPVVVTTVNDAPVGTTPNPAAVFEDSSVVNIELDYNDEESDVAVSCTITSVTNVYPVGGCTCSAGDCSVDIAPLPDARGTGSFKYRIFDTAGNTPMDDTVSFTINSVVDRPSTFSTATVYSTSDAPFSTVVGTGTTIQFLESDTYLPNTYSFSLDASTHGDGKTITSYIIDTPPEHGTLSGCLNLSGSGLNCIYTPDDGNLSDSASLSAIIPSGDLAASVATDTGTFYSATLGDTFDGLVIDLIDVGEDMSALFGTNAKAYYNNDKVTILFEAGETTGADIVSAISSNPAVAKMISFNVAGAATQSTDETLSLNFTGSNPVDSFTYTAYDSSSASTTRKVYISIVPTPDRPTMCEYSTYADTTVCGLNGCIGTYGPSGITPDADGLTFYSTNSGACYISNNGEWEPVVSYIADRSVNELDPIVIDNIRIDEGGGGSEDNETLEIINVDSSDTNLIPLGNISFFYDDSQVFVGDTISAGVGISEDSKKFRVRIVPQTINPPVEEKTSEIEITLEDSSGLRTEVTFIVNVQKVSATHGGWIFFSATGPKVDSLGLVNEDRAVCPYSLDMCENGQKCYGSSSPVNNSFADPDYVDAIYLHEAGASRTCYRMKRTKVQNISYVGKTSTGATIVYEDGGTGNTASVSVNTSTHVITVTIDDDVTETNVIVNAINSNPDAAALVKAINLKDNETQNTQSAVAIGALDNSNWEAFETYCSATPVAFEPACANDNGTSCVGHSAPSFSPTILDSRYWDEQANVCYKSVGTSAASDWVAYDAPAEVTLSWNQFSINGSASIDEYRIYRRLVNEEFDFSLPINKETISGGSATYTYVDNNANSVTPPAPGTVYYYVVRPVVNGILTSTAAETGTNSTGIVRIMAPPKNMAFAHRWMINKTMCDLMNRDTDPTNNYRCLYTGAGDINVSATNTQYYDYGKDLLVDRFEAGCPYSPAPLCSATYDNSCIGIAEPVASGATSGQVNLTPTDGLVYYNRSNGGCYYADGTNWTMVTGANIAAYLSEVEPNLGNLDPANSQFDSYTDKKYNRAGLPPFTQVTQATANALCSNLTNLDKDELLGIGNDLSHRLPTRKDQVAYSQWDSSSFTNNEMANLETGLSLNSTSKCNSSGSSGLEDGYVDIDKPDSNDFYSLPGTFASGIRSMTTGSNELAACVSKFGVQDAIGNVAEWTSHGFNCPLMSTCSSNENLVIQDIEFVRNRGDAAANTNDIGIVYYNGSGVTNVELDTSTSGVIIIQVELSDTGYTASEVITAISGATTLVTPRLIGASGNIQFPFGRAAFMGSILTNTDDTDFKSAASDPYGYWTLDGLRGPCVDSDADGVCDATLTSWAFEDERHSGGRFMTPIGLVSHVTATSTLSTDYDLFEIGPTSGITSLQLHDDTIKINSNIIAGESSGCGKMATGGSYLTGNGAGVWNMEAVPCSDVIGSITLQDITYRINHVDYVDLQIRYVEGTGTDFQISGGVLLIDLDEVLASASGIVSAANTWFSANSHEIEAFVSGNPSATQVSFSTPVTVDDLRDTGKSKRNDVGFRCVIEMDNSDYDVDN